MRIYNLRNFVTESKSGIKNMSIIVESVKDNKIVRCFTTKDIERAKEIFRVYCATFIPSFQIYTKDYLDMITNEGYHSYAENSFIQIIQTVDEENTIIGGDK
jgi:hypothetical protein